MLGAQAFMRQSGYSFPDRSRLQEREGTFPRAALGKTHTGLRDLARQGKEEMTSVYLSSYCPVLPPPSFLPPLPTLTVTPGGCRDTSGPLIRVKCVLRGGAIYV